MPHLPFSGGIKGHFLQLKEELQRKQAQKDDLDRIRGEIEQERKSLQDEQNRQAIAQRRRGARGAIFIGGDDDGTLG